MTQYTIVAWEKDESPTQTLMECTLGGNAYMINVAWSKMSAKDNSLFVIVI